MTAGRFALVAALVAATPAAADPIAFDIPAGRLGDAVRLIGQKAQVSIAVADPALWATPVPRLHGRMDVREALSRLAAATHARLEKVGTTGWRLEPGRKATPARRPAPPQRSAPVARSPAPEPPPADVIVTASKRDLPLDRLAAQVTRVDGEALSFGGVGGTDRLIQRTASVTSTYLGAGRNKLFIRGIADSSFTGATQATVGQYFGDLRLTYNARDPDLRLSDLAAVEVLEGPQGSLYGAGSLGGVIRMVPNAPALDEVRGSAMLGGTTTRHGAPGADASVMLNLPIVEDRVGVRIVADAASDGGYIDKPLLRQSNVNRTRIAGGRGVVRVAIGDGWTADLIGLGQRTRGEDSQYADRQGPSLDRAARVNEPFASDYAQGQLVLSGSMGSVQVRSSTGIAGQYLHERYDATDARARAPNILDQRAHTTLAAHETRWWRTSRDGAGWLLGVSATHDRTQTDRAMGPPSRLIPAIALRNEVDEFTVYGQASVALGDGLLGTAGGRATGSRLAGSLVSPSTRGAFLERKRWETAFLPSLSLLATLRPHTSVYVRYEEGFRPGGLSGTASLFSAFRSDRVRTVEAGMRYGSPGIDLFDLAGSLAYTRWRNIQADFLTTQGFPLTVNAGDGRLWNASIAGGVTPLCGLRFQAAVSINHSTVDGTPITLGTYSTSGAAVTTGFTIATGSIVATNSGNTPSTPVQIDEIPNIARVTARLGSTYTADLGHALSLKADGWIRYVGRSRPGIGPLLGELQGDYLDSEITVRVGRPTLGVTLGATNLSDTVGNRFSLGTPFTTGRGQVTPLRPRSVRLGLDAAF